MKIVVVLLLSVSLIFASNAGSHSFENFKQHNPNNFGYPGDPLFLNETFYSGLLTLKTDSFFYWLFESRSDPSKDPLIIWLSGGPGCSSEIAILFENGPYRFMPNFPDQVNLETNPYSWNNIANVLYIDQPKGIGYSKTQSYGQNESVAINDVIQLVNQFLDIFPAYKGRKAYIGGSSYTGHYVANIASELSTSSNIKLAGVLLGNAWVDPYNQYASHAQFAFDNGLITQAKFLIIRTALEACRKLISQGLIGEAVTACGGSLNQLIGNPPDFNYYNINKTFIPPIGYNFSNADTFLKKNASQLILGVRGRQWSQCNSTADSYFAKDRINSSSNVVKDLLNKGIQVLVYNGDLDLVSNWVGAEYWTTNVTWSGQKDFINAPYKLIGNYGTSKSYKNFIYYRIYEAGHLATVEKPAACLDMLVRFMKGWSSNSNQSSESETIIL